MQDGGHNFRFCSIFVAVFFCRIPCYFLFVIETSDVENNDAADGILNRCRFDDICYGYHTWRAYFMDIDQDFIESVSV